MKLNYICNITKPIYLIISDHSPSLVYYSHIPLIIICVFILFLIARRKENSLNNFALGLLITSFGLWTIFSLITWTSNRGDIIMLVWALIILVEPLIHIGGLYLAWLLVEERDLSFKSKLFIAMCYLPIILLLPSDLNILAFDIKACAGIEGPIASYYSYTIEMLFILLIIIYGARKIIETANDTRNRRKIIYINSGIVLFLLIFTIGNIIGSFTENWNIAQFGLFGMPIFISFLLYNVIEFYIFDLNIIGRNALVLMLIVLIGSLTMITDSYTGHIVTIITFIISLILGSIIIKSTREEVEHLAKISTLASSLESLNSTLSQKVEEQTQEIKKSYELEKKAHRELEKLSETKDTFVSIAQHNLRIPITNISVKIKKILSGTEHKIENETRDILIETENSISNLTRIADDFKDISKIKLGSNILNLTKVSMKNSVENILNELKIDIDNMGITVTYPINTESWPELKIDERKIYDVLMVIIENAIKYNIQNGKIEVETEIETSNETFKMKIKNTGLGLTNDDKNNLLNKTFYRSKRTQLANPMGMGIGLSVSKTIVTLPLDFLKAHQ